MRYSIAAYTITGIKYYISGAVNSELDTFPLEVQGFNSLEVRVVLPPLIASWTPCYPCYPCYPLIKREAPTLKL